MLCLFCSFARIYISVALIISIIDESHPDRHDILANLPRTLPSTGILEGIEASTAVAEFTKLFPSFPRIAAIQPDE